MRAPTADRDAETAAPQRQLLRRLPLGWVVLGLVIAAAAVARPQQLVTTLTSPRALLVLVVIVLLTVLLRRATRGLPAPVASLLSAAPALLAVVLLVLPTLRTTTVDEELDGLAPQTADAASATGEDTQEPTGSGGADAPVRLSTGEVVGIGHRGSGSASVVELADGSLVLRFEDLEVDPGPDYRVYLVPGADKESPDGGVELAPLKASRGNQNYPLDGVPADVPVTALIWCEAFSVPIAAASLM